MRLVPDSWSSRIFLIAVPQKKDKIKKNGMEKRMT